jgi:Holliday junction resolvase RusA-like endonuclease
MAPYRFKSMLLTALAVHFPVCVNGFGLQRHFLVRRRRRRQTGSDIQECLTMHVRSVASPVGLTATKTKQEIDTSDRTSLSKVELENKTKTRRKRAAQKSSTRIDAAPPLHWIHTADAFLYEDDATSDVQTKSTTTGPNQIQFTVRGQPLALKRHRSGNGFLYNPSAKAQQSFCTTVESLFANHAAPLFPRDDYLTVVMVFYLKRPKNHYVGNKVAPERLRPTAPLYTKSPPDVDNLAKFVLDSMNGLLFHDDRQVVSLHATKVYGDVPATRVTVQKLCPQGDIDSGVPLVVDCIETGQNMRQPQFIATAAP